MSSCLRLFSIMIVLAGCGSKGKDQPAGDPAVAPPAATKPTDTAPPAGAAPAAAAATCNLIGKLELRQPTPAAGCGRDPRFAGFVVGLDKSAAASAAAIELDVTPAGELADANVMIFAQSGVAPDPAGACALTLKISDAGRADDDEDYAFAIAVPLGGGAVKGEVVRNAPGAGGKDCITRSAVEGTFTPGGTASGAPMPDVSKMARAFVSLEAYCKDTVAGFSKDACFSQMDQTDMCSCAPAGADDLQGNVTAAGAGGHVKRAALVAVAKAAADYVHCALAVELSDGWHVDHKSFPCGAAPISHDGGIAVTVKSFKVTRNGDEDVIALSWLQDDGKTKTTKHVDCVASSAKVTCPFE